MRKAPGPARRPSCEGRPSRKGSRALPKGCSCMPHTARHGVSSRSSSPVCHCVRPRPDLCGTPRVWRRPATVGPAWGTWDEWRRALSWRRPPPMQAVARRGPRVNGVAAGARPARAGRKRPDGMRWAVRGVARRAGRTVRNATPRRNPLRVIGLQDNNRRRARASVPSRRDLAAFAGARCGAWLHTTRRNGPGGQHDTPARRKEAVDPHHPGGSVRRECVARPGPGGPRRAPH